MCRRLKAQKDWSLITVAATDRAWVFVNGFHVMDVLSRSQVAKKRYPLKKGDVVAVKAMDTVLKSGDKKTLPHEFGFVVDVHHRGRHITTRPRKGPWRVTAMYKTPDPAQQFAFMKKGFNDCMWDLPVAPKKPPRVRATPFPYSRGARYVWASNAQRPSAIVFARLIIEGDEKRCQKLNGQGSGGDLKTCACREVRSADGSVCHYFIDFRKKICDSRRCEPKYECTSQAKDSLICIKRFITHRIVPIHGTETCKLEPDEHYIYVPYHRD
ncbi:unnamed protein product [Chondrus crispus]|uniref:Uncharacterized protein n=1 Tax=Chondrus crispus TaxID=2769 RepID=R7QTU3_CHOCR|nr:unnamed protein product [Chondrus crispus]CDF40921.1 unnamed protein product [Chondrus crispus]|eukprot:XP_005711215.1 unnamed protein product [Chondrus crispus]